MTADAAVWRLAARLGVYARTASDLVRALQDGGRPKLLLLWDLGRSAEPEAIAVRVLGRLLDVPGLRVVAEGGGGEGDTIQGAAVLALDEPRWTDPVRFSAWYEKRRGASPFNASDVYPSPGLALLAAAVPAEVSGQAAKGVHAAWWAAAGDDARVALAALAGAEQPLNLAQWSAIAGVEAVETAARLLPPDSMAGGTWWLPAGPLRDTVTADADPVDPAELTRALAGAVPRLSNRSPDFTRADPAELALVLRQALRAGLADEVLEDVELLAHADPIAVTTALAVHPNVQIAKAWSLAGPALIDEPDPAVRAIVLLARRPRDVSGGELPLKGAVDWTVEQTLWFQAGDSPVRAGMLAQRPHGGDIVLVTDDGTLKAVELASGKQFSVPGCPLATPVLTVGLQGLPDGTPAALGSNGQPYLLAGSSLPAFPVPRVGHLTAIGPLGAAGDSTGRVYWPAGAVDEVLHIGPVTALAITPPDAAGEGLLVSGGADGRVRSWEPGSGTPPGVVDQRQCPVAGVAVGGSTYGLVIAMAWNDGLVRVRRPQTGQVVDVRFGSPVRSVLVDASGRVILVLPEGVLSILLSTPPAWQDGDDARIPAEAALCRLASGEGNPSELLAALLDAELLVCPDAETGVLLVTTGGNGKDGVDACTSQGHVPRHWAGVVRMSGRDLAATFEGLDLRLNPASPTSLAFPLRDLRRAAGSPRTPT